MNRRERVWRLNRPPAPHPGLGKQYSAGFPCGTEQTGKRDAGPLAPQRGQDRTAPARAWCAEGNQNRLRHGIFADRCLTPEEKVMFDAIIDRLNQDFEFNKSSDFLQVELVGVYSVKLVRAQIEGNTDAAEKLDRMIRCHMKDLKTTKIAREGEEPKGPQTSPAEWAAALLEKVAEAANAPGTKPSGRKKRGKNCG